MLNGPQSGIDVICKFRITGARDAKLALLLRFDPDAHESGNRIKPHLLQAITHILCQFSEPRDDIGQSANMPHNVGIPRLSSRSGGPRHAFDKRHLSCANLVCIEFA